MHSASKRPRQTILDAAQSIVGAKGFSAVGLNEILQAADVPKGSFYHYFHSKDAFGVVLLDHYFDHYVEGMAQLFEQPGLSPRAKLMRYWQGWIDNQTGCTDAGKCRSMPGRCAPCPGNTTRSAALRTVAPRRLASDRFIRNAGPETDRPATGSPWLLKMGAATQRIPSARS